MSNAILLLLISSLFPSACSNSGSDTGTLQTAVRGLNKQTVHAAIEQAEAVRLQANNLGSEWTTIEPLLADARKASAQGDFTKAMTLTKEAKIHAELAIKQAEYEQRHWQQRVPHR